MQVGLAFRTKLYKVYVNKMWTSYSLRRIRKLKNFLSLFPIDFPTTYHKSFFLAFCRAMSPLGRKFDNYARMNILANWRRLRLMQNA